MKQRLGLVVNLHVSQLRGQFCLFFGGAKTLDDGLPFMKCTFTLSKRDRFRYIYSRCQEGSPFYICINTEHMIGKTWLSLISLFAININSENDG